MPGKDAPNHPVQMDKRTNERTDGRANHAGSWATGNKNCRMKTARNVEYRAGRQNGCMTSQSPHARAEETKQPANAASGRTRRAMFYY